MLRRPASPLLTLADVLRVPDDAQVVVHVRGDGREVARSFAELRAEAARVAGGIAAQALAPRSPLPILCDQSDDFLPAFWGVVLAGHVPVPLAPEPERLLGVWQALGRPPIVCDAQAAPLVEAGGGRALALDALRIETPLDAPPVARPEDVALLQFSSGSTGAPRGVSLTHANILSNLEQMRVAGALTPADVLASWMPYFHDMGLIGTHLAPTALGLRQIKLGPAEFVKRPALWLQAVSRHRASITSAANFALGLVLKRVTDADLEGCDLSCVRLLGVGAEPISARVLHRFVERFERFGLSPGAVAPMYGLAEATLAVTFSPPGERARVHRLDRGALAEGRARDDAGDDAVELVDVGAPVAGCALRVVGEGGALGDDVVGEVQVRGPNVAPGYHGDATRSAFDGDWLRTGDLGFVRDGRLCLTGRSKDVVIVAGRKYPCHDIEEVASRVPGVPAGRVAVATLADLDGVEHVTVFVPWKEAPAAAAEVCRRVEARVRALLRHDLVTAVPLLPSAFPRTTSGKLRRDRLRPVKATRTRVTAEPAPAPDLESRIRAVWARVLEMPPAAIGLDDRFLEIGGSSLKALEVLGELETLLRRELSPGVLADCATVRELAARLSSPEAEAAPSVRPANPSAAPVAIIGMAWRGPAGTDLEGFWTDLLAGVDRVAGVTRFELPPGAPRWGALLDEDDVAGFDAAFFDVDPAEATWMDPHQRLLLEVAHEALERAGYAGPRRRGRRVGVFAAVGESAYGELLAGLPPHPSTIVGNLRNLVAARLAYALDLHGPVLAIDTACSSPLVALHLARRSLEAGECDLAVVGGANLLLTATPYALLHAAGALSPTGRCRAFGEGADGFVPGEGAGALVLARADEARAAGDALLALVRGSAVNNDGRALSPMAPNPLLQQQVIAEAWRAAGLDPATASYVEAHGTGTAIGDPIEARSLRHAFPADGRRRWLGSVKTNVGHLLNAAGIPSLIKVVLALVHRELPPTLHAPRMHVDAGGFDLVTVPTPWTAEGPLRAGVNGFGFGGTNAHVILEEAPPAKRPGPGPGPGPSWSLLTLSAHTSRALHAAAAALAEAAGPADEAALCVGASTSRDDRAVRAALVVRGDLGARLHAGLTPAVVSRSARPRVALVFAGQGTLGHGLGGALYRRFDAFREAFDALAEAAGPVAGRGLASWAFGDAAPADLARTEVAQPLLVAFELALFAALRRWGVTPSWVAGHSVGELAAAAGAGRFSAADAVRLAAARGRVMQALPETGAMVAVRAGEAQVRAAIGDAPDVAIAAVNGPAHVVLSGREATVLRVAAALEAAGCATARLEVSHAFHSPLIEPSRATLAEVFGGASMNAVDDGPAFVTSDADAALDARWWVEHALRPVRFADTLQRLRETGADLVVEVGPSSTLSGFARAALPPEIAVVPLLARGVDDDRSVLEALGQLWIRGVAVDRAALFEGQPRAPAPPLRFEHRRFWPAPVASRPAATTGRLAIRSLGIDGAELAGMIAAGDPLVAQHVIRGEPIAPAAAIWALLYEAATIALGHAPAGLEEVVIRAPLRPGDVEVRVSPGERPRVELSGPDGPVATAYVRRRPRESALPPLACPQPADPAELYAALASAGMTHGPAFQAIATLRHGDEAALAEIAPRAPARGPFDPSLADAAMQPAAAVLRGRGAGALYLPVAVDAIEVCGVLDGPCVSNVRVGQGSHVVRCDVDVTAASGPVLRLRGVALQRVASRSRLQRVVLVDAPAMRDAAPIRSARVVGAGPLAEALRQRLGDADDAAIFIADTDGSPEAAARSMLALAEVARRPLRRIAVVTRDAFDGDPAAAAVQGLVAALRDEGRGLRVAAIDLGAAGDLESAVDAIIAELDADDLVVRAGGRRRTRALVPHTDDANQGSAAIRPGGVYLVVGGGRGIGAAIARHLVDRGGHVVAAGRGGAAAEPAPTERSEYVSADVTRIEDVERVIAGMLARHGRIDGVVHAAGVVEPGSVASLEPDRLARVLAPKAHGVRNLVAALDARAVAFDFFVAFSSVAPLLPGLAGAVGDYAAANAFLDAFCRSERARGRPFTSIAWSAWRETGMSADPALLAALEARGIAPLATPEALLAFEAALASGLPHVAVVDRRAARPAPAPVPSLTATASGHEPMLRALVAAALKIEPAQVPPDETFLALGLDSLAAVDLVKRLEAQLGRALPTTLFFEHPTVRALSLHLDALATTPAAPAPVRADDTSPLGAPLSRVQRAFYTSQRLYPDVPAYAYVRQTLAGPLDLDRLGAALATLVARHPMLRVRVDDHRLQQIADTAPSPLEIAGEFSDVRALERDAVHRPFDLHAGPVFRAVLSREAPDLAHLVLVIHHFAGDAWSLNVLAEELWATYVAQPLPPLSARFFDAIAPAPSEADRAWWRDALARTPALALPYDGDPDGDPAPPIHDRLQPITASLTAALQAHAAASGVSLFHLVLAAYVRTLARAARATAVAVNVARAGRDARLPGIERVVGCFADTLPLRVEVRDEPLAALARRIRDGWIEVEKHASLASPDLARLLPAGAGPRTASPASFSFARFPLRLPADLPLRIADTGGGTASAATRLGLACWSHDGALRFSWSYPARLFHDATVARLAELFAAELEAGLADADAPEPAAPVESAPRPALLDRIRAVAPDRLAVAGPRPLTYGELHRASDALAARLADTTGPLGLLTTPGPDTVVGLLAILKAGRAWIPLDAEHPPARRADMLARAGARHVVLDGGDVASAAPTRAELPPDTAYVIFTSGSTGRPKGVPIPRAAMENYLDFAVDTFGYHADDRLAHTASIAFDASVRQLLAPLLCGAAIVPVPRDVARDPEALLDLVAAERVTVWSSVPSLWERLLDVAERRAREGRPTPLPHLRWIHVGGEALSAAHVRRWMDLYGDAQRLANLYGPTEVTINATVHVLAGRPADDDVRVPIGRAVRGARLRIESDGELLVGGAGLSPGYLDDAEATARAFVILDGERWYRTGDRVQRRPDGALEFLGRLDDQVKIRGHRVELGEVEAALAAHPDVVRAAVLLRDRQLEAHVATRAPLDAPTLRRWLRERLPAYMVPARFGWDVPLTATGKVDRQALRPPPPEVRDVLLPQTSTEQIVAEAWSRLLGTPVGRDDDFFDLGGDSLKVVEAFDHLRHRFRALPPPSSLWRHRTVAALARAIDEATGDSVRPDETAFTDEERRDPASPAGAPFPLTPAQAGFVLADALAPGAHASFTVRLRLSGPLDLRVLQRAVDVLVARHEMLRVVIDADARPPMQRVLAAPGRLLIEDVPGPAPRFDVRRWPLVRLLFEDDTLTVTAHHAIADGQSAALLARELLHVYDRLERREPPDLPPLRATFREHAAFVAADPVAPEAEAYWRDAFAGVRLPPEGRGPLRALGTHLTRTTPAALLGRIAAGLGDDVVIGVATHGRDARVPDAMRLFGPFATALPVRLRIPGHATRDEAGRIAAAALEAAQAHALPPTHLARLLPPDAPVALAAGGRFFFTFMDFEALGPLRSDTLRVSWQDAPPTALPPGVDLLVTARPNAGGGLHVTLHGASPWVERAYEGLRRGPSGRTVDVDAALVGYLPPAATVAALTGRSAASIRDLYFPDGRPRWLEQVDTPLGRTAFLCLPLFADELGAPHLARDVADAAFETLGGGARCVSFAGLLPALTGYGFDVLRLLEGGHAPRITTGHATTAASIVLTVIAALGGRDLASLSCAFVGLGSVGRAALQLLLELHGPPARLVLVDPRPEATADLPYPTGTLADAYAADLIVVATSAGDVLDPDHLRPGTIVVDDSFPPAIDPARAIARMTTRGDVLVVGGGLLACDAVRTPLVDFPADRVHRPAGTMPSCQLESLLVAATPGLEPVHGLVDLRVALRYHAALESLGVRAAPLHLAAFEPSDAWMARFRGRLW